MMDIFINRIKFLKASEMFMFIAVADSRHGSIRDHSSFLFNKTSNFNSSAYVSIFSIVDEAV